MTETTMSQPLILTLQLDPFAQTFYENLRRRHFPPERNLIPAHLTLFHQLPDKDSTYTTVRELARIHSGPPARPQHSPVDRARRCHLLPIRTTRLTPLRSLARIQGSTHSPGPPALPTAHRHPKQGRSRNRIGYALRARCPFVAPPNGIGLTLWRYLGGPWKHLRTSLSWLQLRISQSKQQRILSINQLTNQLIESTLRLRWPMPTKSAPSKPKPNFPNSCAK